MNRRIIRPWPRSFDFSNFADAVAKNFETNVALEILRMYGERSLRLLVVHALSFRDLVLFFFFFFFDLRSVNLEPRSKFQRASRPKEEYRRGLDKLSRRGAATNGFSSFGSGFSVQRMGSHCYYFVTVLVLAICSNCLCCLADCMQAHRIQSSWASRFFISVAIDQ